MPLDLKNVNTDHSESQIPATSRGMDRTRFADDGGHVFKLSILSNTIAIKMMKRTAPKNNRPHRKVRRS